MSSSTQSAPTDEDFRFPGGVIQRRWRDLGDGYAAEIGPERCGEDPVLVHLNREALPLVGLERAAADDPALHTVLAGRGGVADAVPFASVYAGHQFGTFVPQLGDGRAVTIAEGVGAEGPFELQLKGAGRTPFSRFADGRAVMRSTIREYLCSEHMAALGIPTTRAMSITATREGVAREIMEPGAILARIAPTHLRFGHFEYFHHRGDTDRVRKLADFVLQHFFADLANAEDPYAALFDEVVKRTASLVADWQAVGFVHGVLNTDNMSILGLTIDYGPYGFMERYDHLHVANHSDPGGRYAFGRQPSVALWNLKALAVALTSLVSADRLGDSLTTFSELFEDEWHRRMALKLGLAATEPADDELFTGLLQAMQTDGADHTLTFRHLTETQTEAFRASPSLEAWRTRWLERAGHAPDTKIMEAANPRRVLRNWVAEHAIRAVEDRADIDTFDSVFAAMTDPFASHAEAVAAGWDGPAPEGVPEICVSCSS